MNGVTTQIDVGYGDAWSLGVRKPATSAADWFSAIDRVGNQPEKVTSLNAIKHSATWAAVMVLARDISQIPFPVERATSKGSEPAARHQVHRLLTTRPNPWQTPSAFKRWVVATTIVWGNALVEIVRDSRRQVVELRPIYPYGLEYDVDDDGTPYYYQYQQNGELLVWELGDVLHFSQFSDNGFWGLRLVEIIADEIGLSREVVAHANTVFQRGTIPNFVLQHPGKMDPEPRAELRKSLESVHAGSRNAGKPLFLWEGMEAHSLAVSNVDAQVLEFIEEAPLLIARTLGVPPHKVNDYRHSSVRANLEDSQKEYFASALAAPVCQIKEEMNYKLFTPNSGLHVKPDPTELLKGDLKTQMETVAVGVQSEVITRNEARDYIGRNAVEGGGEFRNPNTTSHASETGGSGSSGEDIEEASMRLVEDKAAAICSAEHTLLVRRASSKSSGALQAIEKVYEEDLPRIASKELDAVLPVVSRVVDVLELQDALRLYKAVSQKLAVEYCAQESDRAKLSKKFRDQWPVHAHARQLASQILGESHEDN